MELSVAVDWGPFGVRADRGSRPRFEKERTERQQRGPFARGRGEWKQSRAGVAGLRNRQASLAGEGRGAAPEVGHGLRQRGRGAHRDARGVDGAQSKGWWQRPLL